MWRQAISEDDDSVVAMSFALNQEDPGEPVSEAQIRRTLAVFRAEPVRGTAVVFELDGELVAYAFLVSFWSNEVGGEICTIDELYVKPAHRNRGIGRGVFAAALNDRTLWARLPVAQELEVRESNVRARKLYERMGFRPRNPTLRRLTSNKG